MHKDKSCCKFFACYIACTICNLYTSEQDHKEFIKAAQNGDSETIERLIDVVDINQADSKGFTPLGLACIHGHRQIVEILLSKHRIDVNKPSTSYLYTPLHLALFFKHYILTKKLLAHKNIDTAARDIFGRSALSFAIGTKNMKMIETLASIITAPDQPPWPKSCFLSLACCQSHETDIGIYQECLEALYGHTIVIISPGMTKGIIHYFLPGIENNFINNKWTLFINKSNNLCVIAPYKATNTEEFCANYGFKNLTQINSTDINETIRKLPYTAQSIPNIRESIDANNPNHPTRFLLDGHGNAESFIADIATESFDEFLRLLTDLNAEFLYINTCGIAGKNLLAIQNHIKSIITEKAPFNCHIALQGTSDNDSFGCANVYNLFKNLNTYFEQVPHRGCQKRALLETLLQKVVPNAITDLISLRLGGPTSFFRALQMKTVEIITWLRLRHIQFADLYTAMLAKNKFQQLSPAAVKDIQIAGTSLNQGLIIPIKPDITCIQMYPQNALNFTFELKGQEPPCFVSKIPGPAQHFLGKITYSSPEKDPQKALHTFIKNGFAQVFGEVKNQSNKCWLIKSLELTTNGVKSSYNTMALYIEGKTGDCSWGYYDKDGYHGYGKLTIPALDATHPCLTSSAPSPEALRESSGGNESPTDHILIFNGKTQDHGHH